MLSRGAIARLERHLNRRRRSERDIEFRRYVRPDGLGVAIMRARPDGVEFPVASPGYTFKPGTSAPTGSNTGRPGEFLLQVPALGQAGLANFPPIVREVVLPPALNPLAWTSPGSIQFFNGAPAFIDVEGVGDGFAAGMSVEIVNQTTPGQFTISNLLVVSPTQVNFRVNYTSAPTPTTDSGDLRLVRGTTVEVEEWVLSVVF